MNNQITISPYNPDWPSRFIDEAHKIKEALGESCLSVHHIDSTSVPSLAAYH